MCLRRFDPVRCNINSDFHNYHTRNFGHPLPSRETPPPWAVPGQTPLISNFEYEKGGFKYQSALHKTHFFVEEGVAIANNIVVYRHTLQKHRKQVFSVYYKERTARRRRENFGVLAKVLRVYPPLGWGGVRLRYGN